MTIINEDWERQLILDSMYSIEQQKQIEEDFWQWFENEEQLPAKIIVEQFNTSPTYEYTRIRT